MQSFGSVPFLSFQFVLIVFYAMIHRLIFFILLYKLNLAASCSTPVGVRRNVTSNILPSTGMFLFVFSILVRGVAFKNSIIMITIVVVALQLT